MIMRFGIVELSLGMVTETGRDFKRLAKKVERANPSRWYNPILIVIPDDFRRTHEEGEINFMDAAVEDVVVAVPESTWGYGAEYAPHVKGNREFFGLEPWSGMPRIQEQLLRSRLGISGLSAEEANSEIERFPWREEGGD